jgi:hypothetical protein
MMILEYQKIQQRKQLTVSSFFQSFIANSSVAASVNSSSVSLSDSAASSPVRRTTHFLRDRLLRCVSANEAPFKSLLK